ncbi:MAG: PrsW family intramembrane metalloprotease, partial [Polyangiaceae bacterium]
GQQSSAAGFGAAPQAQAPGYPPNHAIPQFLGAAAAPGAGQHQGDMPDPDAGRRKVGLALTVLGCTIGLLLNIVVFIIPAVRDPQFGAYIALMTKAAIVAYLPVFLYLLVPWFVDRYDPEPWWALAGVFLWGATFATGVSAVINTVNASLFGEFFGSAVSAPVFEEATKGMAILGMVIFLRREFDGVVDGIIYGTFVAIGFAATENVIYYTRFGSDMGSIFFLRGVLTPWLHPLFTAMIGIGFGLGREHGSDWGKVVFPIGGYMLGVFLHAWWNGLPQIFPGAFVLNLVVGILMALSFFVLVCLLVYRKGKTIKEYLRDEVLVGTITQEEFDLITSYGGRLKARMSWRGKAGAEFVAAGARLALSKWHTARAMKGKKVTISADFIVPLRQEMSRLRQEMAVNARR